MNLTRILVGTLLLAVAGAAAFHLAQRPARVPVDAPLMRSPAMDVAEAPARQALKSLMEGSAGHFSGGWLGDDCRAGTRGERYVWSSSDWPTHVMQRALFDFGPGAGRLFFHTQPDFEPRRVEFGRAWQLDAAAAVEFHDILRKGEYFSRGSTEATLMLCDADTMTLESCIDGRYYGVVRSCESLFGLNGQPRSQLDPLLRDFVARQTQGDSLRRAANAAMSARSEAPPPGL